MQGNEFFIVILLLWTFVDKGVNDTVTGVLHGTVELKGRNGQEPNVTVEWVKYENSTRRLICVFKMANSCSHENISCYLANKSLIFVRLTKNDEGIYEETTIFCNGSVKRFTINLSVLFVSNISISSSSGSLTLKCETNGKHLQWFMNDRPLPDNQRFNLTESNKTLQVSNLNSSDCGMYTCQVSNEHGQSTEFKVNIRDKMSSVCLENTSELSASTILIPVGVSLISFLVLCIILINVYKYCICGKSETSTPSTEEPVYNEPTFFQEEPAAPTVEPLIVYQDFLKPKHFHQFEQSEDFGYSTIADPVETIQLRKIST